MIFLNKLLRALWISNKFKKIIRSVNFSFFDIFNFQHQKLELAYENSVQVLSDGFNNSATLNLKTFNSNQNLEHDLNYSNILVGDSVVFPKPLHVMMLGLRGFPNVQGGVEAHVENLAPILVNMGCELEVISRSPYQKYSSDNEWRGVKFIRIWAPKSKGLEAIIHTFLGVLYAAVKRPDILHIHAIGPAIMTPLARLFGLRVVVTHHGPDYERQKWGNFARNILLLGEWMGMRLSNGRIVISNVIRDLVVRKHGVNSALISNGVVMPSTDISEIFLEQFGIKKNKYILLVSRFVPEKRHIDLIEAFNLANLSEYKLVLVGAIDHPDTYTHSVIDAALDNSNIVLTGFQSGDILRSLYTHAAMFVLPSSHEGLSIALLEALSYGLPVIASNIPANLELDLNPRSYFDLGNIGELANLIILNVNQPASIESRVAVRTWVNNQYNWQSIAEKTHQEYLSVINKVMNRK